MFAIYGKLSLTSNVTYLMDYNFNGTEFAGFVSTDFGTLPHWKDNTRVTYSDDIFTLSLNWQYIGKSTDTLGDIDFDRTDPVASARLKAQNYFDLNARVKATENFEFFGGVQNLLDKQPPLIQAGFTATNTDETLYDTLGRRFFIGAKNELLTVSNNALKLGGSSNADPLLFEKLQCTTKLSYHHHVHLSEIRRRPEYCSGMAFAIYAANQSCEALKN